MNDTRKWIATAYSLPTEGQKIYYFSEVGIFRGEYRLEKERVAIALSPHTFVNDHGKFDSDEIPYWMPYDHALKDIIPLPPNYQPFDFSQKDAIIDQAYSVDISDHQREFSFTYVNSEDIKWIGL